jgi:hypothetical protein
MQATRETLAETRYRARPQDEAKLRQLDILAVTLAIIMMLGPLVAAFARAGTY